MDQTLHWPDVQGAAQMVCRLNFRESRHLATYDLMGLSK